MENFNPNAGGTISLAEFEALKKRFEENFSNPSGLIGVTPTKAVYMSEKCFKDALAVPGAVGLRTYFGMYEDGTVTTMIVAVDSNGSNILNIANRTQDDGGYVWNLGQVCPPACP